MSFRAHILATTMAIAMPLAAPAMQLDLPGNAALSGEKITGHGSYHMPISAWENGAFQTIWTEGEVAQQAWKITATGLTSLQILEPLKQQLTDSGFELVYECETEACGGFDFRFNTDVMSEPAMHIDLGDFRFLAAQRMGDAHPEYISLLISRSQNAGFVQLMRVGVPSEATTLVTSTKNPVLTTITQEPAATVPDMPLEQALQGPGRFILEDLTFQTGSSDLGDGPFESLVDLANYLQANPDQTFMLVGHTDAEGSLAGNIALSKKRARSVVRRLVSEFGVNKSQVSAEGNGFLSPLASNLTEDGRAQNRRVEVIATSTQ